MVSKSAAHIGQYSPAIAQVRKRETHHSGEDRLEVIKYGALHRFTIIVPKKLRRRLHSFVFFSPACLFAIWQFRSLVFQGDDE